MKENITYIKAKSFYYIDDKLFKKTFPNSEKIRNKIKKEVITSMRRKIENIIIFISEDKGQKKRKAFLNIIKQTGATYIENEEHETVEGVANHFLQKVTISTKTKISYGVFVLSEEEAHEFLGVIDVNYINSDNKKQLRKFTKTIKNDTWIISKESKVNNHVKWITIGENEKMDYHVKAVETKKTLSFVLNKRKYNTHLKEDLYSIIISVSLAKELGIKNENIQKALTEMQKK